MYILKQTRTKRHILVKRYNFSIGRYHTDECAQINDNIYITNENCE